MQITFISFKIVHLRSHTQFLKTIQNVFNWYCFLLVRHDFLPVLNNSYMSTKEVGFDFFFFFVGGTKNYHIFSDQGDKINMVAFTIPLRYE